MNNNTFDKCTITYCGVCGKVKNITGDYHGTLPNTTSGGSPWCLCSSKSDEESAEKLIKPQYSICDRCHGIKAPYIVLNPCGFTSNVDWTGNNVSKLCTCSPETTKHSGNLDDYEISDTHAEAWLAQEGIVIEVYLEGGNVRLNAHQALSLLSWLKQEEVTLTKFAEKDNV